MEKLVCLSIRAKLDDEFFMTQFLLANATSTRAPALRKEALFMQLEEKNVRG